jgi:hypothetical protein
MYREELESSREQLVDVYENYVIDVPMIDVPRRRGSLMANADLDLPGITRASICYTHSCCNYMIVPTSPLRLAIDLVSLVALSYDLFSLPYLLAFDVPQEGAVLYLTYATLLFWIADMGFTFRTGVYKDGSLLMDPVQVARHYVFGHFFLDLLIVTMDSVSLIFYHWQTSMSGTPDAFRLGRVVKLTRLVRCMNVVRMKSIPDIMERLTMGRTFLHATSVVLMDTVKFAMVILWLNHAIACGWYSIGMMRDSSDTGRTWLDEPTGDYQGGVYGDTGSPYLYTTSLHWAITQMTPGSMQVFPVNSSERIYNCSALIFGMLVFSTLISSISSTVSQFKTQMNHNNSKLVTLRQFLKTQRIRPELCMQVEKQVAEKLKWKKPLKWKDVNALDLLSLSLRSSLQTEICLPYLLPHVYFRIMFEMDALMTEEMCRSCTDSHVHTRGDTLFLTGAEGAGMHFIKSGCLSYSWGEPSKGKALTEEVGEGRWLAEASLWCLWRHVGLAELDSAVSCEVMTVLTANLMEVLHRWVGHPMSWAYAQSFCACLSSSKDATDLHLHFGHAEVMSSMPLEARIISGRLAMKALSHEKQARLTNEQLLAMSREVESGRSVLMMTGTKVKVHRVVAKVALRLYREDGMLLVSIVESAGGGSAKAACQLPQVMATDGEDMTAARMRLLEEAFGQQAGSIDLIESTVQEEHSDSALLGIPTKTLHHVIRARWPDLPDGQFVGETVAQVVLKRGPTKLSIPGGAGMTPPASPAMSFQRPSPKGVNGVKFHLPVDVFELHSGQLGAWVTEEQFSYTGSLQWLPDQHPYLKTQGAFQRQGSTGSSVVVSTAGESNIST